MRVLLQRVTQATVSVASKNIAAIDAGLLAFVCAMTGDTAQTAHALAVKTAKLRIFSDELGKMNRSLLDVEGACLVVSQFTLAADTRKGKRPSYTQAAEPETALELCHTYAAALEELGSKVSTGRFGEDMQVLLINDGPVTIWLDSTEPN